MKMLSVVPPSQFKIIGIEIAGDGGKKTILNQGGRLSKWLIVLPLQIVDQLFIEMNKVFRVSTVADVRLWGRG